MTEERELHSFPVEKISEKTLKKIVQEAITDLTSLCSVENERHVEATYMPSVKLEISPSGRVLFKANIVEMPQ